MKKNQKITIRNIRQSRSIMVTLVGIALLVCVAVATVYIIQQRDGGSLGSEDSGQQSDLTSVINDFCGKTIQYPREWNSSLETDDARGSCAGVSFFTYHRDEVASELKSDGRYPTNASYFDDVKDRELVSYPYSLDKVYEIQLEATDWGGKSSIQQVVDLMTEDPFGGEGIDISGLRTYSLKDREVADYMRPGEGNFLAQRILLITDKDYRSGYMLTINRSESRLKMDQSKIDKLDQFVASLPLR